MEGSQLSDIFSELLKEIDITAGEAGKYLEQNPSKTYNEWAMSAIRIIINKLDKEAGKTEL